MNNEANSAYTQGNKLGEGVRMKALMTVLVMVEDGSLRTGAVIKDYCQAMWAESGWVRMKLLKDDVSCPKPMGVDWISGLKWKS